MYIATWVCLVGLCVILLGWLRWGSVDPMTREVIQQAIWWLDGVCVGMALEDSLGRRLRKNG